MSRILVVGLCCVDIVHYVDKFPKEDSDTRVFDRETCLGGNAANNITVLRQFSDNCELFASVPAEDECLYSLLNKSEINAKYCIRRVGVNSPVSTAIINSANGSRTIFHYRGNLPELDSAEFEKMFKDSLSEYGWIHFEGRNFEQIRVMMEFLHLQRAKGKTNAKVSVELEKIRPYPYLEQLIPLADVIFVSKDFAIQKGWNSMTEAVRGILSEAPESIVICAWGEMGAAGCSGELGEMVVQPAFPVSKIVDTLGAGDCFIGVSLKFLNEGDSLTKVLEKSCRIAAKKCGQKGLLNLNRK